MGNSYRLEIVNRTEAHTGNDLACLHVMIDSNSNREIADTYIPLDDVQRAIKEHKATERAADIATRRSQGARDGWEIRRAKTKEA